MRMRKIHSIILLLVIFTTQQVSGTGSTETQTIELLNGRVVKANERLLYVSLPNGSINITSSDADFKPCELKVDDDSNAKFRLGDATALGNGKIIVWKYGYENNGLCLWKIYIIDPVNCKSTTVTKVANEGAELNKINTIIPYHDNFDVFSQYKECSPCRFKDDGKSIDLPESTYKTVQLPIEYSITPIGGANSTSGYLLTQTFDNRTNCSSLLKILSPTFEVQKEQQIDRYVETVSTNNGQIRICSTSKCLGQDNNTHDCQVLDSNLRGEKSLERITEKENVFLEGVQNFPDDGAIAAFVNQDECFMGDGEGSADVVIRRIRAGGQVDPDIKFGSVQCWEYDFQNFKMQDGSYCLVAYDGVNTGEHTQTVYIKCLKYDE